MAFCAACSNPILETWKGWPHVNAIPFLTPVNGPTCRSCSSTRLLNPEDIRWVNVHGAGNTGLPDYWLLQVYLDDLCRSWGRPYLDQVKCSCGADAVVSEFGHAGFEYAINCGKCGVTKKFKARSHLTGDQTWQKISEMGLTGVKEPEPPPNVERPLVSARTPPPPTSAKELRVLAADNVAKLVETLKTTRLNADRFTTDPNSFCMNLNIYECGAPACIAGWAAFLCIDRQSIDEKWDVERIASAWLGLDHEWAMRSIFHPKISADYNLIEPSQAVAALEMVLNSGADYLNLEPYVLWNERL